MKTAEWLQIEKEFIEWDNETHSNASQRQILDWFEQKFIDQIDEDEKESSDPQRMSAETKVLKYMGKWTVKFTIGNQSFILYNDGNKKDALWMQEMLNKAFNNFASQQSGNEVKKKEIRTIPLLTATIKKDENIPIQYCGWINEEKGCIAQADTEKECKEKLLTVWWIKHHVEKTYTKKVEKKEVRTAEEKRVVGVNYFAEDLIREEVKEFMKHKRPQDFDDIPKWHIDDIVEFALLDKSASQFQEQPITVTNKMIKAKAFELCPVLYIPRITGNKKDDINKDARKTIIDAIRWALSLKAQKAQPGDEDIINYALYYVSHKDLAKANRGLIKDALIIGAKAMRDGKIPVSGKDEKA